LDKNNQPYSLVIATPGSADWTIDASHETIEMLIDPNGNRLQTSRGIEISGGLVQDASGEFDYLVEACDPCEGNQYAYSIQGIAVSDFITPHFYDPEPTSGTRYSFGGHISRPRQVLPGGYISYINTEADEIEQILYLGKTPILKKLGSAHGTSLRVFVDGKTHQQVRQSREPNRAFSERCEAHRARINSAALERAKMYEHLLRR
jgi:hypothetical protein